MFHHLELFVLLIAYVCILNALSPSVSDAENVKNGPSRRLRERKKARARQLEQYEDVRHQKYEDLLKTDVRNLPPWVKLPKQQAKELPYEKPDTPPPQSIPPGRYCKTSKRKECVELLWSSYRKDDSEDVVKEVNVMYSDGRSVRPAASTNHTWIDNELYVVTVIWPEEENKIPTTFYWNMTLPGPFNNATNQSGSDIYYLNGKERGKGKLYYNHYFKWKWSPLDIEVALITDTTNQDKVSQGYVFLDETFPESGTFHPNTYLWSGLWAEECPTHPMENTDKDHNGSKIIGTTMAHYQIWQEFYRRHQDSENPQQRIIIFEDDAECAVPNCGDIAIKQLLKVDYDIVWLGWCWYYGGWIPPFCLHAYSINVRAAKVLTQNVFPCVRPGDNFVADLGRQGVVSWTLANVSYQYIQGKYGGKETHDFGETKGLFTQKGFTNKLNSASKSSNSIMTMGN